MGRDNTESGRPGEVAPRGEAGAAPHSAPLWSVADVGWASAPGPAAEDGRYERRSLLGAGGMGRVLVARDARLGRDVALKEAHPAADPGSADARLNREARIAALLEHPAIVPVYDAGESPSGRPWYVMRLVRGRSLEDAIGATESLGARLGLLRHYLATCEALAYAHHLGIVHRDLKPANVMVGEFGETQVVDWGLARMDGEAELGWTAVAPAPHATVAGAILGTPAYMSPEQADGRAADARSDVYGLGATLFHLIAGRAPLPGEGAGRLRADVPEAPPELLAILERAMAAEPDRRYQTAATLLDDVRGFLEGRRVAAHRYSAWDLLRRLVRAWRAPLAVAAGALVILGVLGALATMRVVQERSAAQHAEGEAVEARERASRNLAAALVQQARVALAADARPELEVLAAHALRLRPGPEAAGLLAATGASGHPTVELDLPMSCHRWVLGEGTGACLAPDHLEVWDTRGVPRERWRAAEAATSAVVVGDRHLATLTRGGELVLRSLATGAEELRAQRPYGLALASDGSHAVLLSANAIELFDEGGASIAVPACATDSTASAIAGHPHGGAVVACIDGSIARWTGRLPQPVVSGPLGLVGVISAIAVSKDGETLIAGTSKGSIGVIGADGSAGVTASMGTDNVQRVVLSPDGRRAIVVLDRGGPALWSPASGASLGRLAASAGDAATFAGDGDAVVTAGERLRRFALPEDLGPNRLAQAQGVGLTGATPSPDGSLLALTRGDGKVTVVDRAGVTRATLVYGARAAGDVVVKRAAFSRDGRRLLLACAATPGGLAYDTTTWERTAELAIEPMARVATLRDGTALGITYDTSPVAWDATGRRLPGYTTQEAYRDLEADAHGDAAVLLRKDGLVELMRAGEGPQRHPLLRVPDAVAVHLSRGGARVAVVTARRLTLVGGPELAVEAGQGILDVALSDDGALVALARADGTADVLDGRTGELRLRLRGHDERVAFVEWLPQQTLVTAAWDGTARLWSARPLPEDLDALVRGVETTHGLTLDGVLGPDHW
ncbi:MAG: hypothetical protein AMXMBFR64_07010 [Myxococcales bacterium]